MKTLLNLISCIFGISAILISFVFLSVEKDEIKKTFHGKLERNAFCSIISVTIVLVVGIILIALPLAF